MLSMPSKFSTLKCPVSNRFSILTCQQTEPRPPTENKFAVEHKVATWYSSLNVRATVSYTDYKHANSLTANSFQNKAVCDNLGVEGKVKCCSKRRTGHNERVFPAARHTRTVMETEVSHKGKLDF